MKNLKNKRREKKIMPNSQRLLPFDTPDIEVVEREGNPSPFRAELAELRARLKPETCSYFRPPRPRNAALGPALQNTPPLAPQRASQPAPQTALQSPQPPLEPTAAAPRASKVTVPHYESILYNSRPYRKTRISLCARIANAEDIYGDPYLSSLDPVYVPKTLSRDETIQLCMQGDFGPYPRI
ncbi:hypothetical protein RUND412_008874 [Rhizina undulata]